jgi:kynureninase
MMPTRSACITLDQADPLAAKRSAFLLPEGKFYLDGNSLGALPKNVPAHLVNVVQSEWGQDLITAWTKHGWIDLPSRIAGKIAPLLGVEPSALIVGDSVSVNLFKLVASVLAARPERRTLLCLADDFPTDVYILQGLVRLLPGITLKCVTQETLPQALGAEVGVLLLSHVHYKTAAVQDMPALCAQAQAHGIFSLWDLSHAAGVLDLDLEAAGVDGAVGCGYKYLNGGPGAPAYLYLAPCWQHILRSPIQGWMGHAQPFDFSTHYEPAPGMARWLAGTPPILSLAALDAALDCFAGLDMRLLRAKAQALGDLFLSLVEAHLPGEFAIASPAIGQPRGGHVSLRHPNGYALVQALIARGVVGDFRAPDLMRFGFSPLYVRYQDIWDSVAILADVVATQSYMLPEFQTRGKVT